MLATRVRQRNVYGIGRKRDTVEEDEAPPLESWVG